MNRVLAIILSWLFVITANADDERILVSAKINGKPVKFALDTGTSLPIVIYSTTARKLGLKILPPNYQSHSDRIVLGATELCELDFGVTKFRGSLKVIEMSSHLRMPEDGIIGWPGFPKNVFSLDAIGRKIPAVTNIAEGSIGWIKFYLQTNLDILGFDVSDQKGNKAIIFVDTGFAGGIELNSEKWCEWITTHTNQPTTVVEYYTPNPGIVVAEEKWADEIRLDSLVLTDVPVVEAHSNDFASVLPTQAQYEATLGLAALKRLDIIIDNKNGFIYLRPKTNPPLPYEHNRLGAVFSPVNPHDTKFVAYVANGSPAYEAGIRDGDILVKVNDGDKAMDFYQPVGTKFKLTLKRGDKIFEPAPYCETFFRQIQNKIICHLAIENQNSFHASLRIRTMRRRLQGLRREIHVEPSALGQAAHELSRVQKAGAQNPFHV